MRGGFEVLVDFFYFQHAPHANITTGLFALSYGKEMVVFSLFEFLQVFLGGRVCPHFFIHSRGDENFGGGGEIKCA